MAAMDKENSTDNNTLSATGSNNSRYCDTHYVKKEGIW